MKNRPVFLIMAILALGTIATTCFASQIVNAQTMVPRKVLTCNSDDNVRAIAHPHSFATKNLFGGTEASSHTFCVVATLECPHHTMEVYVLNHPENLLQFQSAHGINPTINLWNSENYLAKVSVV